MRAPTVDDFEMCADALGTLPELVEKDYYAIKLLKVFLEHGFKGYECQFGGGTCLGKAHIDTQRMSEDVDVKLIPSFEVKMESRSKQRAIKKQNAKLLVSLINEHSEYTISDVEPQFRDEYKSQAFYVTYPRRMRAYSDSIKPDLQLELTECLDLCPATTKSVSSIFTQFANVAPEIEHCRCVSLIWILAEKLISLLRRTAESSRDAAVKDDPFLIRHVYDIHLSLTHDIDNVKFKSLFEKVIAEDKQKYRLHTQFSENPMRELAVGLGCLSEDPKFEQRFHNFIGPLVYREQDVAWKEALASVQNLFKTLH